jgi:hypothetical protein
MDQPLFIEMNPMDDLFLEFVNDSSITGKYSKKALSMINEYGLIIKEGKESHAILAITLLERFSFSPHDAMTVILQIYKDFSQLFALYRDGREVEYGGEDGPNMFVLIPILNAKYPDFSYSFCCKNINAVHDFFWMSSKPGLPVQLYPLRMIPVPRYFEVGGIDKERDILLRIIGRCFHRDFKLRSVCRCYSSNNNNMY